jgi:hypothetical protein
MLSPGSITNSVPDPDRAIRLQRDVQRNAQEQASAQSLGHSQIGADGLAVTDGGSIILSGGGSIVVDSGGTITLPTGTLSAANVTATAALSGATVAVTGAATSASSSTTGNATVGGDINLTGDLYTPHGKATPVTSGYVSAWLNGDGRLGATASTRASKRDLVPLTDLTSLMSLTPYLGRYIWDADDAPLSVFLIADEVQAAGFGPDVAPLDEDGKAFTVNYSQMVVPLLAAVQALSARLDAAGL